MGGPGSGGWYRAYSRDTVEGKIRLSTRLLTGACNQVRAGDAERISVPLTWTSRGEVSAQITTCIERRGTHVLCRLLYTTTPYGGGQPVPREYSALMLPTPSNLPGNTGVRWWFRCPLMVNGCSCGRRVAYLYYGNGWFGCRTCHNLSYDSCNESHQFARMAAFLAGEVGISAAAVEQELRTWSKSDQHLAAGAVSLQRTSKKFQRIIDKGCKKV
jgi:hypothetical protein